MRDRLKSRLKAYGLNLLGICCLALVPVVGPWPGPGGIPLTLAGLKLLAVNNPWAEKLMAFIQKKGLGLSELIFPEDRRWQLAWDTFIFAGLAVGGLLFIWPGMELGWQQLVTSSVMSTLGYAWLQNRRRWRRLLVYLKIKRPGKG